MDLQKKRFTKNIAGKELVLETSRIAEQTNAAIVATYGGTTVLATVVMEGEERELDYLPLTVDYEEKFYAVGKILGSRFVRREGRPSEEAVLSGRLVDRVIRPLFDKRIRRPIQVVVTVLSYDGENDPDFVSLIAASAALGISDIPWSGPAAGVNVAKIGDKFEINPSVSALATEDEKVSFSAFFAGTESFINMIEMGGYEAAEDDVAEAAEIALSSIKELVAFQKEIIKEAGKPKTKVEVYEPDKDMAAAAKKFLDGKLEEAVYVKDKNERSDKVSELKKALVENLKEQGFENALGGLSEIFEKELDDLVHRKALNEGIRPDGRAMDEVRELHAELKLLPRAHGSALFVRGNTQALAVTTLGSPGAEQLVETIEFSGKKKFMLHYNFPPFSVGEARSFRGPGRRDIGHGALAEKAIRPLLPKTEEFPYTIRVVSEILSSNGSSSMATVSATALSLMDAGVPIKAPAAGIAIGLVSGEGGEYKLLTDIQGPEDHYGDMDMKIAGTRNGINAMQMDVKIDGITVEILKEALARAKDARMHILDETDKALSAPRSELSPFAPRILTIKINPSDIGEVIGSGGKVINGIIEKTGVTSIDIDDDGTVYVSSESASAADDAIREIELITRDLEIGEIVEGEVVKILEFGAIVELGGGKSGMIHISELKDGFVENVESVLNIGDKVRAKVVRIENGKTALSIKQLENKK